MNSPSEPHALIVYGDFNCPFSALANSRVAQLEQLGAATVDWRSVEHDSTIPHEGAPIAGCTAKALEREIEQIRDLLAADERDPFVRPTRQINTQILNALYAGTPHGDRARLRGQTFTFYWRYDVSEINTLASFARHGADATTAAAWQREWERSAGPIVPMMVLPDGYTSRGLGALERLRRALDGEAEATSRR